MIQIKKQKRNLEAALSGGIYKKTAGDVTFNIINITVFSLFALACLFPFYYLLINTISNNDLVNRGRINFYPIGVHLANYFALAKVSGLFDAVKVTVLRTFIGTALMVLFSAFAGYLATKEKMWNRRFWYRFIIIPMYFNAGLIPWYVNMLSLGLTNNFLAYIIPGLVAPFNIIMVKTYIESIPRDIEESARIDGAGTLLIFFRIVCPLCLPILATISIFGAVGHWNSLQDSLLLMTKAAELQSLQHKLYIYLNQTSEISVALDPNAGLSSRIIQYTISVLTIIPIVIVYPTMQRFFIKGIMMGAVKG